MRSDAATTHVLGFYTVLVSTVFLHWVLFVFVIPAHKEEVLRNEYLGACQEVFATTCATCHGQDGRGMPKVGPDLIESELVQSLADEALVHFVASGRSATDPANRTGMLMPPRGGNPFLSDGQIWRAVQYLRSLTTSRGEQFVPSSPKAVEALVATRVSKVNVTPQASYWAQAPRVLVSLRPQQMAMPSLAQTSISNVEVQAVNDGRQIAFRVSWLDPTADGNVDSGRFSDAVAVGFPLDRGAPPTMGAKDKRMQILYWRALWQKDLDEGFQDVQVVHPNFWADLYWFAEGKFPYPVPEAFRKPEAKQFFPAHQAGNPMADFRRTQPVQELLAEGWGTLTHQAQSASQAKGVWSKGRWAVTFARPLRTRDPLDYQFTSNSQPQLVVAVWNGSAGDVGGRKQWSNWIKFEVK